MNSSNPSHRILRLLRVASGACLAVLMLLSVGCEESSNVGLESACITFEPDSDPVPGMVVARRSSESNCDQVIIELVLTGVVDVWAGNFKLDYPVGISQIGGVDQLVEDFSFLATLGVEVIQQLDETSPGFVVGAISRVGTLNGGVTPTDSDDILMRMAFIRFATSGSGPLTFSDANIDFVDTPGLPPEASIPPIDYIGGTILMVPSLPEE